MGQGGLRGSSDGPHSRRAKRSSRSPVPSPRPESKRSRPLSALRGPEDPELWLEGVAFPEPADDPALAELEDEELVLGADELSFDAEQWREASERYAASGRAVTQRASSETTRVQSRRTRALPRQESSRRDSRGVASTGPTRRIPRASAPISPSLRARAAQSVTARLSPLSPRPAAHPPVGRPSQPCWGSTVRRRSFRVSGGGLSKAQALAVTWPEIEPDQGEASKQTRPPLEILVLAALSLGLLLALGGPFLLQQRSAPASRTTAAALTSGASTEVRPADTAAQALRGQARTQAAALSSGSSNLRPHSDAPRAAQPKSSPATRVQRLDPRLRRRGEHALASRVASEEALGAAGGARLRIGLACGVFGAQAFVPLRFERLETAPAARSLTWELRHDARLEVEAVVAGPAAREAAAKVHFKALGPGRLRVRVVGQRPLARGELCVVRLSVPPTTSEEPLPRYLPLEAIALRLDEGAPRLGAGARGALRLEP